MRYSGIGGQAVLEGIMMKNAEKYSVAVRCPDGSIASEVAEYRSITEGHKWMEWPILRGVFRFVDSLKLGMKTLTYSAEMAGMEEAKEAEQEDKKSSAGESLVMGGAILGAVAMTVMPDYPAHDYLTAIAVGIASGLGATGVHQVYKQLFDREEVQSDD